MKMSFEKIFIAQRLGDEPEDDATVRTDVGASICVANLFTVAIENPDKGVSGFGIKF